MKVEQYRIFQIEVSNKDVAVTFRNGDSAITVRAFSDNGKHFVRFSPAAIGEWSYRSTSGEEGAFDCIPAKENNHGYVKTEGFHFRYADGTRYLPFGTTCYALVYQSEKVISQTLDSLKNSPFNKVRILVFPKSMAFNTEEPEYFPFLKAENGKWDISRPDSRYWSKLENLIERLGGLGIEVDLILFHPYDKWGFAAFTRDEAIAYLDYTVNRLSAYKNIWWSLANEYELLLDKTYEDWDAYAEEVKKCDVYGRLLSIHNFCNPYPKRAWMSHCSIQSAFPERAIVWRSNYGLPVIDDECGYEGNLEFRWGNLSAFELVNRIWKGVVNGGYCTHGETFYHENEVIWWAKGGTLEGKSIKRIAYLKSLLEELGEIEPLVRLEYLLQMNVAGQGTEFMQAMKGLSKGEQDQVIADMIPPICGNDHCRLYYFGRGCPLFASVSTPTNDNYRAEIIDVWEMTRSVALKSVSGDCKIQLPAKEGMAVLLTKI